MAGSIDPQALSSSLDALRVLVQDRGILGDDLAAVTHAAVALFRVGGAGVMIVDDGQVLRYVAATDGGARALEAGQEQLGYGPCVDALVHDRLVTTPDVVLDERWPRLGDLVGPHGVRAVLGVPVKLGGGPVGSLNVYHSEPRGWDDTECAALQAFAGVVERVMSAALQAHQQSSVVAQLQHALDSRIQIERAVGLLMGRDGIDAVEAFDRLRREARGRRIKVVVLAGELLEATSNDRGGD